MVAGGACKFLFMLYSLYATSSFQLAGVSLSEFSLAVGVGDRGIQCIDDVQCFMRMHGQLSFLLRADRVLWIIIAHSLVPPHIVGALCDLVVYRGLRPTR